MTIVSGRSEKHRKVLLECCKRSIGISGKWCGQMKCRWHANVEFGYAIACPLSSLLDLSALRNDEIESRCLIRIYRNFGSPRDDGPTLFKIAMILASITATVDIA